MTDALQDRVTRAEVQIKDLVGNGQPGRVALMERRLERSERIINRIIGFGFAINFLLAAAEALRFFR